MKFLKHILTLADFAQPAESYDSRMATYLQGFRKRKDTKTVQSIEANIAVMKKWASEGK